MTNNPRNCSTVRPLRAVVLSLLVAALAACGSGDSKKPASQVAAKVNKEEVSVHQVNYLLSKAGQIPADKAAEAKKQALNRLVDQELLVQKAMEAKLDRNPNVLQALEASKREILAAAYLEQVAAAAPKPTADEVKAYYAKHPELFAERKIYRLREVAVAEKPENRGAIKEQLAKGGSLEDLLAWLKERNIPFRPEAGVKAAEQLPLELLPRLHQLKDGQAITFENANGLLLVQVLATQSQPIDEKGATPVIENFLTADKRKQLAAAELKKLKEAATIEYVGEFAGGAPATAKAEAAPAAEPAKPDAANADAIAKGLKGIK